LGNNPDILCDLRFQLRDMVKNSPLMDEQGYAAQVEKLYHRLME
jgi:predicted O-linked N-acetylglucosamine transferase (SPINDLY family)